MSICTVCSWGADLSSTCRRAPRSALLLRQLLLQRLNGRHDRLALAFGGHQTEFALERDQLFLGLLHPDLGIRNLQVEEPQLLAGDLIVDPVDELLAALHDQVQDSMGELLVETLHAEPDQFRDGIVLDGHQPL
jgi:hypothetical protein